MKSKMLALLLTVSCLTAFAQKPKIEPIKHIDTLSVKAVKTDTLMHFQYQYKNEAFPFDSGVAISDIQYRFLHRQVLYGDLDNRILNASKPSVKNVYVDRPVRRKGDGNRLGWGLTGGAFGAMLAIVIRSLTR